MTRERLLEIFNYNNKRVKQGYLESDVSKRLKL
jgi:hypothetical protein